MEYHNCLPLPEELENIVMEKKEELEKRDAVRDALEKRKIQQEKYTDEKKKKKKKKTNANQTDLPKKNIN